ncbi:MAG: hypothetical protein RBS21_08125, partial [Corynebacterium sp.]|nr:hypothetical protein [Corynebacterium sp.]
MLSRLPDPADAQRVQISDRVLDGSRQRTAGPPQFPVIVAVFSIVNFSIVLSVPACRRHRPHPSLWTARPFASPNLPTTPEYRSA